MRLSQSFFPVAQNPGNKTDSNAHKLMVRAGLIHQESAGLFSWLPLGRRVLDRVQAVIETELEAAGAQKISMPLLQDRTLWEQSERLEAYGPELFQVRDRKERSFVLVPTAEEQVTELARSHIHSARQLPVILHQSNLKFRDELRPRNGVVRSKEFLMSDAYSFDVDEEASITTYARMTAAYGNIFRAVGVHAIPARAHSGQIGGSLSHEFVVLDSNGEGDIRVGKNFLHLPDRVTDYDDKQAIDRHLEQLLSLDIATDDAMIADGSIEKGVEMSRVTEIGHTFYLGTKYSRAGNFEVSMTGNSRSNPHMGCYGIGISRLISSIIDSNHDELGIMWPSAVAPYDVGLVNLAASDEKCQNTADALYKIFGKANTLYDDTADRPGAKFARMDLVGVPLRVTVGPRDLAEGLVEIKDRRSGDTSRVHVQAISSLLDVRKAAM